MVHSGSAVHDVEKGADVSGEHDAVAMLEAEDRVIGDAGVELDGLLVPASAKFPRERAHGSIVSTFTGGRSF
jgi:hypothetical protein